MPYQGLGKPTNLLQVGILSTASARIVARRPLFNIKIGPAKVN
jgi:hypothetical protein